MSDPTTLTLGDNLAPLLPRGAELRDRLEDEPWERLQASWQQLTELGFEVEVRAEELLVRHRDAGFETVIQLSRPDDLGELRGLFLALRKRFGRVRDRWLPWLFLPGQAVTDPYEHLREIIATCQKLRQAC
jgi:hypothetical protein